jgi:DNA replication licensing factor MCM4
MVDIDRGYINEPSQCPSCMTKGTLAIVFNRCGFADRQVLILFCVCCFVCDCFVCGVAKVVKLQETPDAIPEGETPQTVTLNVYQELLDVARPGDRVVVTGIFRANPVRHNSVHRSARSVYRTYIDAMHFEKEAKRASDEDDAFVTIFEGGEGKKGEELWPPERVELFKVINFICLFV